MIGYIEAVTGIGLIMGPIIGSVLYSIGGYTFIFYSFGGIFIVLSFFIKTIFPDRVDKMNPGVETEQNSESDNDY